MMNENNNIIALRRQELGLSQSSISDALGYSVQTISKWEKGKSFPSLISWGELAKTLQIDLEALLDGKLKSSYNQIGLDKTFSAEKFAENLKKQRRIRDLTQTELASVLSISYQTILTWEKGSGFPNVEQFKKLAEVMNLSYEKLYFAEDDFAINKVQDTLKETTNTRKSNSKIRLFLGLILMLILVISITTMLVVFLNRNHSPSSEDQNSVSNEQYTISLDVNGGDFLNEESKEIEYNQNYTLPIPTRTGYTFVGWYNKEQQLTDENGQSLSKYYATGDMTLTAKWTVNDYKLTLSNTNENAGSVSGSGTYTYGTNVTISATANEGYGFIGWYKNGACVSTNNQYTFTMGLDTLLNAKWGPIITLNYVVDGETVYTDTYTLGKYLPNVYQYPAKNFYGWYESKTINSSDTRITSVDRLKIIDNNAYLYGTILDTKFDFEYNGSGYSITKYKDTKTEVTIPSIINGIPVTSIGEGAFYCCSSLTSITIPNSVTSIGESAFSGCNSLIYFCEASSQPSGWSSNWNHGRPVYWKVTKEDIIYQNDLQYLITNGKAVVTGHKVNITEVIIPSTIEVSGTTYNVTHIGEYAFSGCSSLSSVKISNNVIYIGNYAFYECKSLISIEIPISVTNIGEYALYGCGSLVIYCEASSQPNGWSLNWINGWEPVYWGINEKNYLVQDGLIYVIIDGNAVVTRYKANITDAIIPLTITLNGATYNVTSIGTGAFASCNSLTTIEISNNITSIGFNAFYGCSSLTTIEIPNSVTSIDDYAFSDCGSLTIYCEASSQPDGWDLSWNSSNRPVYWGVTEEDIIKQNDLQFLIINGNAVVLGHTNELSNNVVIPSTITTNGTTYNVTSISDKAFFGCDSLTSITIPNSVTSIGESAFYGCSSLTTIEIPSSVANIGAHVFSDCGSLTIYCEASSQPDGWDSSWNSSNRPVYWAN